MPEGHTLHRLARDLGGALVGRAVRASSPQGRFADGARRIDGRSVTGVTAYGKHLFASFDGIADTLHVHLGLYGTFIGGPPPAPPVRGALRLRLVSETTWWDLRGPTACDLLEPPAVARIRARLGPDPLARRPDGTATLARLARTRMPIGAALMDQSVVAGVGNVYRAELLYRHAVEPHRPAATVDGETTAGMWDDLVTLMRAGVRTGRIVTTRPEHRGQRGGAVRREDAHYVYRRAGLPCRVCGTEVRTEVMAGRNLYWCPYCQA
jgi:formamidopyrimidine-DNA glycosylase